MDKWKIDGRPTEIRCQLCGTWLPVLTTRKGKPYYVCGRCGSQTFTRYEQGICSLARAARHANVDNVRLTEG